MRVAYVHGFAGVSGPMLLGALFDAGASLTTVQEGWRALRFPAVQIALQRVPLTDYTATSLTFSAPQSASFLAHHTYTDLHRLIAGSSVSSATQQRLLSVLSRFADAVGRVHGWQGAAHALPAAYLPELLYMGSGVILALEELAVEQCLAAPLNLGAGCVEEQQETFPVPRPLTAALVRDVPVYGDKVAGEHTSVGGAAILTALATSFGPLPSMTVARTGYGASVAEAPHPPRGLQVLLGDVDTPALAERIAVLEANIDDMNPEFYEDIYARLFAQGALDVTLTPLLMKKNRPANKLTVLAPLPEVSQLSRLMLCQTSTFGVRVYEVWRQKLERFYRQVETCYGVIAVKCGVLDGRIVQAAPEYEDCKRAALEQHVPVRLVYAEAARFAAPWLTEA
ncbi:MAG: LarC family nickel insertion protein [Candidatus Tectomicrobia bacterium]